jgi:hypothetical protein
MSATPRPARLSKPSEVVAILVASAVVWVMLIALVATLFFTVFIPAVQFGGRGQIPNDFPVYPSARLDSAVATVSGRCTTVTASWSTPDDAASVVDFYRRELAAGDWTVTDTRPLSDSTVIYFQSASAPNREGYVSVLTQSYSSRTYISMTMAKSGSGAGSAAGCHVLVGAGG